MSSRTRNQQRRKLMIQRVMGFLLLAISVVLIVMARAGATSEEQDGTALLFILPLAMLFIFGKEAYIV